MASVVGDQVWRRQPRTLKLVGRWILILGLAYLAICAVLFGVVAGQFFSLRPEVAVPSVIGRSEQNADHTLRVCGLIPEVVDGERSDLFPTDTIMRQTLVPGSHVRQGRTIHLIRCPGPAHVIVPEVRGLISSQAVDKLAQLGLQPSTASSIPSATVPFDAVIEQLPVPGSRVETDSIVALVVSDGPPADGSSDDTAPQPAPHLAHPNSRASGAGSVASASPSLAAPDETAAGDPTANDPAWKTPTADESGSGDNSAAVVTSSEPGPVIATTQVPGSAISASAGPSATRGP